MNRKTQNRSLAFLCIFLGAAFAGLIIFNRLPEQKIGRYLAEGTKYLNEEEYDDAISACQNAVSVIPDSEKSVRSRKILADAYTAKADFLLDTKDTSSENSKHIEAVEILENAANEYQKLIKLQEMVGQSAEEQAGCYDELVKIRTKQLAVIGEYPDDFDEDQENTLKEKKEEARKKAAELRQEEYIPENETEDVSAGSESAEEPVQEEDSVPEGDTDSENTTVFDREDDEGWPDGTIEELSFGSNTVDDITGDGKEDQITITASQDSKYKTYYGLSVAVNGTAGEILDIENIFSGVLSIQPYLVQMEDGRVYLYINLEGEDAVEELTVFDLNETVPFFVGSTGSAAYGVRAGVFSSLGNFTDASGFTLGSWYQQLSSQMISRQYHVGDDGMPVAESDWFYMDEEPVVTMKMDINTLTVEDFVQGKEPEDGVTVVLPAGTQLTFYRTDGVTRTDLKDPNGKIYRITVTDTGEASNRYIIGPYPVTEVLDGTVYYG